MRKAAHHSDGMDSLNPHCWWGERLYHHGGGVCWLFVLLWMDSWRHELIICKKWYKNNLKMRLTAFFLIHVGVHHIICNRCTIGTEAICKLTKEQILLHKKRLSVDSYKEYYETTLKPKVTKQYQIDVDDLKGMLLSPLSRKYPDGYATCSVCFSGMQSHMATKKYIHHWLGKYYKHVIPFWNIIPTYIGIRYKQKKCRQ